jgi:hypothetical protein
VRSSLKKPFRKKGWWGGSRCRPEFNPQYCKNMDEPRGYYLSKLIQVQKDKYHRSHLYVESKKVKLIETETRMVVVWGWAVGVRC